MKATERRSSEPAQRLFAPLVGLASLAIFFQAVSAGEFMSDEGQEAWVEIHNVAGYATLLLALAAAVVGVVGFRQTSRQLAWGSAALAPLAIAQLVIGHLITDLELDGWIAVHVPLALLIFGLSVWLAVRSAALRRR